MGEDFEGRGLIEENGVAKGRMPLELRELISVQLGYSFI